MNINFGSISSYTSLRMDEGLSPLGNLWQKNNTLGKTTRNKWTTLRQLNIYFNHLN